MGEFVNLTVADGVGTIRLDRPKMNALNVQVQDEIQAAAEQAGADDAVRAVVVYGGEKVFAAGADIKEMADMSYADMVRRSGPLQASLSAVAAIPKPTVAAITGYALGGGCELALCADYRIAADDAKLGQPEILLGIIPGGGGTQRLPRMVGVGRAKELIYSGRQVRAPEAKEIGLVNEVFPDEAVYPKAVEAARRYAHGPLAALRAAKVAVNWGARGDVRTGLVIEREVFADLFSTEDQKTGMQSLLNQGPGKATFSGR
jgi:enoyl-CoA hydratase/carnithine racemase